MSHSCLTFSYLDPKYAEASYQFDSISGKMQHDRVAGMKVVEALMKEQYLPLLMTAGYHVVHTIPVWTGGNIPIGAFTNFHFHIISETVDIPKTLEDLYKLNNPVIMIAGVGSMKALPELSLPPGRPAPMGGLMRHGTVILSHSRFLEHDLLRVCSAVNAKTAFFPVFFVSQGQDWKTLAESGKGKSSDFKFEKDSSLGELHYKWHYENIRKWPNESTGSSSSSEPTYTFSCVYTF